MVHRTDLIAVWRKGLALYDSLPVQYQEKTHQKISDITLIGEERHSAGCIERRADYLSLSPKKYPVEKEYLSKQDPEIVEEINKIMETARSEDRNGHL
jgi:hypothetical protein